MLKIFPEIFADSTKVYYICAVLIWRKWHEENLRNSRRMKMICFSTWNIGKSFPILSRG